MGVLVRWAKGKRLTDRLPNLCLITLSPPGTDRILRVDAPPHAVPISGDTKAFFRFLTYMRKLTFLLKKRFHGGREIRTHDPTTHVLPTTPFVKVLIRWAKGKRLTNNRVPNLSLITRGINLERNTQAAVMEPLHPFRTAIHKLFKFDGFVPRTGLRF